MAESTAAPAGRREWIGLAVLALPTLLLSLDMSVLYLALPKLSEALGVTGSQQLWIMDSYGFMIAGFLITMGTLGDRIGRRKLLLIGAAAFAVASVIAAYSVTPEMLIAARFALGIAGATLMPSTLALISNMFRDPRERSVAIGVWMACFLGGMVVGPVVGGVLLAHFWWGSAFLLGVPVMVVLLITAPFLLPEYRDASAGRLDLVSVGLSLAAILPIIYGLKESTKTGFAPLNVAAIVVGLVFGAVFLRRQRRLASPLMDLRLFTSKRFTGALCVMFVSAIVMAGSFLFISQYLQLVVGLPPTEAGLWTTPQAIAMIGGSLAAPRLARRIQPAYLVAGGLVVTVAGLVLLTTAGTSGLVPVVVASILTSIGMSPTGLVMDVIVGSAPPERAGSAAALSETSGELGIAMGVAVMGSVGAAVYRGQLDLPADVPTGWADTASESLAAAVATIGQLPAELAGDVLAGAREAFTAGMNLSAGIGAVALAGLAVVAFLVLRQPARPESRTITATEPTAGEPTAGEPIAIESESVRAAVVEPVR